MPLINVNNTTDPKNSVTPNEPFQNVPVNIPASSVVPVEEPKVTEYQPQPDNSFVDEPDIKQSFENKLSNLSELKENVELPPLPSMEERAQIESNLPKINNESLSQSVVAEPVQTDAVEQSFENSKVVEPQITAVEQVEIPITPDTQPIEPIKEPVTDVLSSQSTNVVEQVSTHDNNRILELDEVLTLAIKRNASDIHFTPGYRTMIRVDGKLEVAASAVLTPSIVNQYVMDLLRGRPEVQVNIIKEFDLTYTMGNRRFRVNIFRQMGNFSITLRIIPERILSIAELGLPEIIKEFPSFPNGLVLVTGPTGSGKSTTIAAILNQINLSFPKHIVTLEDPIEFVFPKGIGLVDQRESGIDFTSWNNALRSVLRQDPDVVLVGEMRDLETVEAALQIAETGHLVFATLHTNGAAETINRVIDIFEANKQDQIRVQLSSVIRAVVSQKLIPVSTGGRKAAVEILLSTPSVKNAIRDKKTFQINNIIQTSSETGMISMEKSLVKMVRDGLISKEVAKSLSINPNEIDILLQ